MTLASEKPRASDQPQTLEARVAVLADDDVIVDRDAEWLCRVDDHSRHINIGARRGRVSGRMVMDQNPSSSNYLANKYYFACLSSRGSAMGAAGPGRSRLSRSIICLQYPPRRVTALYLVLLVPCVKLMKRIKYGLADFDEAWSDAHCAPVSQGSNRDAAAIPIANFLRSEVFQAIHVTLLCPSLLLHLRVEQRVSKANAARL